MERRQFIKFGFAALAFGAMSLLTGCTKTEAPQRLGNQDGLWNVAMSSEQTSAPLELAYAKNTPAFFRDESLGKVDPNFKPKIGGG
jgi:hypothetical protein